MKRILVLNPNSSTKVTEDLKNLIPHISGFEYDFYTAPKEGPLEILGMETSNKSEAVVLPDLIRKRLLNYDGYLICCFSDHPLVHSLEKYTDQPILGIMHGSLAYVLLNPRYKRLIILTSVKSWEPILDKAIVNFYSSQNFPTNMAKTVSFNINVTSLNNSDVYSEIASKVKAVLGQDPAIDSVVLGCAGMVGLDVKLNKDFYPIKFIDSVKVSVELLAALVRYELE